jgi:DNA polymerase-3 subunit beta
MQFVIKKADLVRELQTVTGVVEKRATVPILANLLLEASDAGLHVGASDLEVTIRGLARAEVVDAGSVTLPAGKLHEIARSLPDSDVQFKVGERNQVHIKCDRTRYKISGQSRDDFPSFPEVDETKGVRLPGKMLHDMIERVSFAITTDDPRYALQGALCLLDKTGVLTLVATDTHRLAYVSKKLDTGKTSGEIKVIISRKALAQVSKMTADMSEEDEIVMGLEENHVFFAMRDHRLTCNVLEGNFPNYENVMPEDCETKVTVPTEELLHAVKRVALLGSDQFGRAVQLSLSNGKLELSSKTEVGEAQETLSIEYEGDEIKIGFNARYLQDFLSVVGTSAVQLEFNPKREGEAPGETKVNPGDKPGQFRPMDSGMDYRYVVMPMHL